MSEPLQKIGIRYDGFYRVGFDDLVDVDQPIPSANLVLMSKGVRIPIVISDADDGLFGPGDSFHFTGQRLPGAHSWYNAYSHYNVYQLLREKTPVEADSNRAVTGEKLPFEHLEEDELHIALTHGEAPQVRDLWYWRQITHQDLDGFSLSPKLKGVPTQVRIALAGRSRDKNAENAGVPQHQVIVTVDDRRELTTSWNGQQQEVLEIALEDFALEAGQELDLSIRVLPRAIAQSRDPIIDVVLLDWIEIEYEESSSLPYLPTQSDGGRLVVDSAMRAPAWIERHEEGMRIRALHTQTDYLMIAPRNFLGTLQPLMRLHQRQGLDVTMIAIEDIYQEFNHGIESPVALQNFLSYAHKNWGQPPYALLAGDASWARDHSRENRRNRIPTMWNYDELGPAASDYALLGDGEEEPIPPIALGRLPAGDEGELKLMVQKLLTHTADPHSKGSGLKSFWISDSSASFQRISNELSLKLVNMGWSTEFVFPPGGATDEESPSEKQQRVLDAFSSGASLLHFLGHGGRFVWRTGPIDLRNHSDLFSVDDLGRLASFAPIPLVMSMTCSSGPFDHPTASSLAESLLLAEGGGALAIIAASRRVVPSKPFSARILEGLAVRQESIGEALLAAKRQESRKSLVASYNLLGDPAMRIR